MATAREPTRGSRRLNRAPDASHSLLTKPLLLLCAWLQTLKQLTSLPCNQGAVIGLTMDVGVDINVNTALSGHTVYGSSCGDVKEKV